MNTNHIIMNKGSNRHYRKQHKVTPEPSSERTSEIALIVFVIVFTILFAGWLVIVAFRQDRDYDHMWLHNELTWGYVERMESCAQSVKAKVVYVVKRDTLSRHFYISSYHIGDSVLVVYDTTKPNISTVPQGYGPDGEGVFKLKRLDYAYNEMDYLKCRADIAKRREEYLQHKHSCDSICKDD